MTTFRIDSNDTFSTEVTVRESDKYTGAAYVRFDRHYIPEEIRGCSEMFMSATELRDLGLFLVESAKRLKQSRKQEPEYTRD